MACVGLRCGTNLLFLLFNLLLPLQVQRQARIARHLFRGADRGVLVLWLVLWLPVPLAWKGVFFLEMRKALAFISSPHQVPGWGRAGGR